MMNAQVRQVIQGFLDYREARREMTRQLAFIADREYRGEINMAEGRVLAAQWKEPTRAIIGLHQEKLEAALKVLMEDNANGI